MFYVEFSHVCLHACYHPTNVKFLACCQKEHWANRILYNVLQVWAHTCTHYFENMSLFYLKNTIQLGTLCYKTWHKIICYSEIGDAYFKCTLWTFKQQLTLKCEHVVEFLLLLYKLCFSWFVAFLNSNLRPCFWIDIL